MQAGCGHHHGKFREFKALMSSSRGEGVTRQMALGRRDRNACGCCRSWPSDEVSTITVNGAGPTSTETCFMYGSYRCLGSLLDTSLRNPMRAAVHCKLVPHANGRAQRAFMFGIRVVRVYITRVGPPPSNSVY